jgi:hypothetical protein
MKRFMTLLKVVEIVLLVLASGSLCHCAANCQVGPDGLHTVDRRIGKISHDMGVLCRAVRGLQEERTYLRGLLRGKIAPPFVEGGPAGLRPAVFRLFNRHCHLWVQIVLPECGPGFSVHADFLGARLCHHSHGMPAFLLFAFESVFAYFRAERR